MSGNVVSINPAGTVAADQLRLFIERAERLYEDVKGLNEDLKGVFAEAKANGYDPKAMKACIKLRRLEPHQLQEWDAVLETYRAALGLG